eukprot:m.34386 g.34386  ORF g.34386 m.34386 type:complete len:138 (-) comp11011_c1_seq1:2569-2982(-)
MFLLRAIQLRRLHIRCIQVRVYAYVHVYVYAYVYVYVYAFVFIVDRSFSRSFAFDLLLLSRPHLMIVFSRLLPFVPPSVRSLRSFLPPFPSLLPSFPSLRLFLHPFHFFPFPSLPFLSPTIFSLSALPASVLFFYRR